MSIALVSLSILIFIDTYATFDTYATIVALYLFECDTYSNVIGRKNFSLSEMTKQRHFNQIQREKKEKNSKRKKLKKRKIEKNKIKKAKKKQRKNY